jgi:hypothetical protein
MQKFTCHKEVEAATVWSADPISNQVMVCDPDGRPDRVIMVPENFFGRGVPSPGDYFVRYDGGYVSWSPKSVFEDGYTLKEMK